MFSLKQFIKSKIKNQVISYIQQNKEEILKDFYYNVVIDSEKRTLSEISINKSQKENELFQRLEFLEREHGRRQWEHVWYAYSRWWTEGASDELLKEFEYKERFFDFWEDGQPCYWLIYIACLINSGKVPKAIDIAKKYKKYYGITDVYKVMPAAALFRDILIVEDDLIKKSAEIYNILLQRQNDREIEHFILKAKDIAIVGNCRREIGKNKGEEIDRHDVVIRINGAVQGDELKTVEDYGEKCDMWARCGSADFLHRPKDIFEGELPKWLLYCDDYENAFVHTEAVLDMMYDDVKARKYCTCSIPSKNHFDLRERSQLINPTSGAYLIWYIYSILGDFKKVDFYGFSFMDKEIHDSDYEADTFVGYHYMDREMDFLYNLWEKNS